MVSYLRSGLGRSAVAEHEWFEADGSTFRASRQVAQGAVGRFAGELTADELNSLEEALHACEAAEPAEPPLPAPGATMVTIDIGGTSVQFGDGDPPSGPWARLADVCERLVDAVLDRPAAAIGIVVDDDGARLEHRGDDELDIDLSDASFVAVAWQGWYEEAGRLEGRFEGDSAVVGPGWSIDVPVDLTQLAGDDLTVHVIVTFTIGADREATAVQVSHAPDLERPT